MQVFYIFRHGYILALNVLHYYNILGHLFDCFISLNIETFCHGTYINPIISSGSFLCRFRPVFTANYGFCLQQPCCFPSELDALFLLCGALCTWCKPLAQCWIETVSVPAPGEKARSLSSSDMMLSSGFYRSSRTVWNRSLLLKLCREFLPDIRF